MNWIAPLLVSKERKLEVLKDHLIRNFCVYGECSEKDWEDIHQKIFGFVSLSFLHTQHLI